MPTAVLDRGQRRAYLALASVCSLPRKSDAADAAGARRSRRQSVRLGNQAPHVRVTSTRETDEMATYIALCNFTDQGIRNVKDTVKRADMVKEAAQKAGLKMDLMWTLGSYDIVVTFEAPNDAALTAFALSIGAAGNIRSQTLRAFNRDEMMAILAKMG
jgi:uncharacterized protein with GYD domain